MLYMKFLKNVVKAALVNFMLVFRAADVSSIGPN